MLRFKKAAPEDLELYFDWANDPVVRAQSYNSDLIDFENHKKWFQLKLNDDLCLMLIFQNEDNLKVGQIRIQKENNDEAVIGISIDSNHRGKSYAKEMLEISSEFFLNNNQNFIINAFIKEDNLSSKYAFEKAGFEFKTMLNYENFNSFHYIKKR